MVLNERSKEMLENFGIHAGFSDEVISESELQKQGYERMPESAWGYVNMLFQQIPDLMNAVATEGMYQVIWDRSLGGLQHVKDHPGLFRGNVVAPGTNNDLQGGAVLRSASVANVAVGLIFTAMSAITGQYFLSEINDKLSLLSSNIESVYQFLETDKRSKSRANERFLMQSLHSMPYMQENQNWMQSTLINAQKIRIDSMADVEFYSSMVCQKIAKLNASKNKRDAVISKIQEIKNDMSSYYYALYLYTCSLYLDTMLSENTKSVYIRSICQEIHRSIDDYQKQIDTFVKAVLLFIEKNYNPNEISKKVAMASTALVINSLIHNPAVAVPVLSFLDEKADAKSKDAKEEAEKLLLSGIERQFDLEPIKLFESNLIKYDKMLNRSKIELICISDSAYVKSVPFYEAEDCENPVKI